jgi:hypothetical protein
MPSVAQQPDTPECTKLRSINRCLHLYATNAHPGQPVRAKTSCAVLSIIRVLFRKQSCSVCSVRANALSKLYQGGVGVSMEERKGPKDPEVVFVGSRYAFIAVAGHAPHCTPKENVHSCVALTNRPANVRTRST